MERLYIPAKLKNIKVMQKITPSQKVEKMVFDNLNRILNTSKEITKQWNQSNVSLIILKTIIEKSKPASVKNKTVNNFIVKYRLLLDILYSNCERQAKLMDSESIPIEILSELIKVIKQSFTEGMKQ